MRFLFSPYGRTTRLWFWVFVVIYVVLTFGSIEADRIAGSYNSNLEIGAIETLVGLFLFWPSIAVPVRRFHDLGMTGWWVLWIVIISIASVAVLFCFILITPFMSVGPGDIEMIEEGTSLQDMPAIIWIALAVVAIPYLVELFMLGFMRGEEGKNRFDLDSKIDKSHSQDDASLWIDR